MAGIDAFGTQLYIGDQAGTSYDVVAEVVNVGFLDVSVDDIDVSSHDSESGWREFIGGLKDGGELSFDINFDPSLHSTLLDLQGVTRNMKVVMPAGVDDIVEFEGHLKSLSGTAPYDDKLSASASIKVSGPVTITIT